MSRRPLFVANWKMSLSHKATLETLKAIKKLSKDVPDQVDVVIAPSFPSLAEVASFTSKADSLQVAAQNVHWEESGAWTGEVSVSQISPFVSHCIIGHSERRRLTGETDQQVAEKAALLVRHGITPVVCIGESWEERQAGTTVARVTEQAEALLAKLTRVGLAKVVVTYEPIWAISSNNPTAPPDPSEVAQNMLLIRKLAAGQFGNEAAERLRVIYGGSVTADNVREYVAEPGVDGALVGSASLKPTQFVSMINTIAEVGSN